MGSVCQSSRMDAAKHAIRALPRDRTSSAEELGSASSTPAFDPEMLQDLKKTQLRSLAIRIPSVNINKKTSEGKWIHKTSKELKAELLAVTTNTSTQALLGRTTSRKRPAAAPTLGASTRKRPAAVHRGQWF